MSDAENRALLPEGLHDALAPKAEFESAVVTGLLAAFSAHGYEQVAPPLVEFEESLLAGVGAAESRRMFRLMDPVSTRMMGVRTDMTTQVARIATTRLASAPRPLRLSYAGQVLRVASGKLRSEREFGQAGIELVGSGSSAAEAEVLLLVTEALRGIGMEEFSVDLTIPAFVPLVCAGLGLSDDEMASARKALDEKDMAALDAIDGEAGPVLDVLLRAAGEAGRALGILDGLALAPDAAAVLEELKALVAVLKTEAPGLRVTIDPGEYRSFEYHSGVCFAVFSRNTNGELGRGGRYNVQAAGGLEPAVGFTFYVDSLLRALPKPDRTRSVFVPFGTRRAVSRALRDAGWRTLQGLQEIDDKRAEAKRLGCSHVFGDGRVEEI
ncbi:MAG: ATP phosphoribosyltransferase regulatory subunit [Proteobacteria bacterium]|nr:ATP phosphoribosyltransferase regulatory subunit [Pseudomonadota bacterium]